MLRKLLSSTVSYWWAFLFAWGALFVVLRLTAPNWEAVVAQGEFEFLPADAHSQRATRLLNEAFPGAGDGSTVLFLIVRDGERLGTADTAVFIDTLLPLAERVGREDPEPQNAIQATTSTESSASDGQQATPPPNDHTTDEESAEASVARVEQTLSPDIPIIGDVFESADGQAAIAVVELSDAFLDEQTWRYVNRLEEGVEEQRRAGAFPEGLEVYLTGSAVLGRDLTTYRAESANWIQRYTGWLVIGLLLIVFRAPLIALIPLVTLACAVDVALNLLALLADYSVIVLFDGVEVFLTVIAYGAGVDYSLFLISRYREELTRTSSSSEALRTSLRHTGRAIVASALTEIVGIGVLWFASFGKLSISGVSIAFALAVMLIASLTLTPALLRLGGRNGFWPVQPAYRSDGRDETAVERLWSRVGTAVTGRPRTAIAVTTVLLSPLAVYGATSLASLSYGLIEELPRDSTTTQSLAAIERHFPVGMTGPVTVVLENADTNFQTPAGQAYLSEWTDRLLARGEQLRIADVHSMAAPLGDEKRLATFAGNSLVASLGQEFTAFQAAQYYVSQEPEHAGHVSRAYLTLTIDPYSREAIRRLDDYERAAIEAVPEAIRDTTEVWFVGGTSSLRSMQKTATSDQLLLFLLITAAVTVILMLLLKRTVVPLYLVATVLLTFFTTVGATDLVFGFAVGPSFTGLDWSVPLLLFTVLMAVGSDYNVLLVTRADEEMQQLGRREGVVEAVRTTGSVITGCGVVMAGTFATLLIGGRLASMQQLGFALTLAVLLDTFLIRTLLVPAFLRLVARGDKTKTQ